jgi:hypothetical protein
MPQEPKWRTREGVELSPREMATPHLLSTIHMVERSRMQNLMHLGLLSMGEEKVRDSVVAYYGQWPDAYAALLDEAERRGLLGRGTAVGSTKLARRREAQDRT